MAAKLGIEEGMRLHAKYAADGEFYPAVVVAVSSAKNRAKKPVKVSYNGYDEEVWVSINELKNKKLGLKGGEAPAAKAKAKGKAKAEAKAKAKPGAPMLDCQMPKKVVYFNLLTPVGLPTMCCLEISRKKYEGEAVKLEDWGDLKPKTPGGQLPYAEMKDGTSICESGAIGRSVAAAAGLLGLGKDFSTSEMLVGIATDLNKEAMGCAPTIMNKDKFDSAKKDAFPDGKQKVLDYCAKAEKFLLEKEGKPKDRFTPSGKTYGEIYLFCILHCHAKGALPEVATSGLKEFYDRMVEMKAIKKVLDGESKFGELAQYLVPLP